MSARFTSDAVGRVMLPQGARAFGAQRDGDAGRTPIRQDAARRRVVGRWATACCAALVLAGCSGESAPAASSGDVAPSDMSRIASGNGSTSTSKGTKSSAVSTSLSAPADRFAMPEAAKAHTHEGAKAFVKFYWQTLNALDRAPQEGVLPRFGASDCESCRLQEKAGKKLVAEGARIESKNARYSNFQVRKDSTPDSVIVTFVQEDDGSTRIEANGARKVLPPVKLAVAARADWNGAEWKLGASGADERP